MDENLWSCGWLKQLTACWTLWTKMMLQNYEICKWNKLESVRWYDYELSCAAHSLLCGVKGLAAPGTIKEKNCLWTLTCVIFYTALREKSSLVKSIDKLQEDMSALKAKCDELKKSKQELSEKVSTVGELEDTQDFKHTVVLNVLSSSHQSRRTLYNYVFRYHQLFLQYAVIVSAKCALLVVCLMYTSCIHVCVLHSETWRKSVTSTSKQKQILFLVI